MSLWLRRGYGVTFAITAIQSKKGAMKGKISQRFLDTLQPKARPYWVFDDSLPGFTVRVQPSGAMSYYVRSRTKGGREVSINLGSVAKITPQQARDLAKNHLADIVKGEDPSESKRKARSQTLKDFLDQEYGPWLLAHRKSGAHTLARLRASFAGFQSKRLCDITSHALERWRSERMANGGVTAATTNRDIAELRAAMNRAVSWRIITEHPFPGFKLAKEDRSPKPRYLTSDEERRLRDALDLRETQAQERRERYNKWRRARKLPEASDLDGAAFVDHLKPMVLLSLNTGLRKGEVFNLQWKDIDLGNQLLTVQGRGAKSSNTRHVPLNTEALQVLTEWRSVAPASPYVFPGRTGGRMDNIQSSWEALLKLAKIEGFRWHDLRHHFASILVQRGADLNTVRDLLGHGDIKMTLRYAHMAHHVKARAVDLLMQSTEDRT